MDDTAAPPAPKKRAAPRKTPAATAARKPAARKAPAKEINPVTDTTPHTTPHTPQPSARPRDEARSRFNAALEEAKAGAAALKAEGKDRAAAYRDQARGKSEDWVAEAKAYGSEARVKGRELAVEGKGQAAKGLRSLGQLVSENASVVDEKLGAKYGEYARSASDSLSQYADRLDEKTVDDLAEDAREMVRKSPGLAVGIAAFAGFMLSRLFRRSR